MTTATLEPIRSFMRMLNERFPIDRSVVRAGNHSLVYDTTGNMPRFLLTVWTSNSDGYHMRTFKLDPEDFKKPLGQLVNEIVDAVYLMEKGGADAAKNCELLHQAVFKGESNPAATCKK